MADVVYTIDYDDANGLTTTQSIEKIGSAPDRVRFVTSKRNEYKMALKRDTVKNPTASTWAFKANAVPDPYLIPLKSAPAQWIDVVHAGGNLKFHYICGYIDAAGKFQKWPKKTMSVAPVATKAAASAQSLPWPS